MLRDFLETGMRESRQYLGEQAPARLVAMSRDRKGYWNPSTVKDFYGAVPNKSKSEILQAFNKLMLRLSPEGQATLFSNTYFVIIDNDPALNGVCIVEAVTGNSRRCENEVLLRCLVPLYMNLVSFHTISEQHHKAIISAESLNAEREHFDLVARG